MERHLNSGSGLPYQAEATENAPGDRAQPQSQLVIWKLFRETDVI